MSSPSDHSTKTTTTTTTRRSQPLLADQNDPTTATTTATATATATKLLGPSPRRRGMTLVCFVATLSIGFLFFSSSSLRSSTATPRVKVMMEETPSSSSSPSSPPPSSSPRQEQQRQEQPPEQQNHPPNGTTTTMTTIVNHHAVMNVTANSNNHNNDPTTNTTNTTNATTNNTTNTTTNNTTNNTNTTTLDGVVVLGMHRSGTSMLAGLLVTGLGYHTGGRLLAAGPQNAKGFFELHALVRQDDVLLQQQGLNWDMPHIYETYNPLESVQRLQAKTIPFEQYGPTVLHLVTNASLRPFLLKDPRICITLPTWLALFPQPPPAVVFTYRHPLEVAKSLHHRESKKHFFPLSRGLRLWIAYNQAAIQNSQAAQLCRVTTSNNALLANPADEINRIVDELTHRCRVAPPPNGMTVAPDKVNVFVDPRLQHSQQKQPIMEGNNNNTTKEEKQEKNAKKSTKPLLALHNNGTCPVYEYYEDAIQQQRNRTTEFDEEQTLYLQAMKIYCDLESGAAFHPNYPWPLLRKKQ